MWRWNRFRVSLVFIWATLFVGTLASGALAATLEGAVVSKKGKPKTEVRVDLLGVGGKRVVMTDAKGRFRVEDLKAGKYRVRVTEGSRKMDFQLVIPDEEPVCRNVLQVQW